MKKIFLPILFLLIRQGYAQEIKVGNNYQFITSNHLISDSSGNLKSVYESLKVFSMDEKDGEKKDKEDGEKITNELIQTGLVVRVNYIDDGKVYFTYWRFPENDVRNQIYAPSKKTYRLAIDKFKKITTARYDKFVGWRIKPFTVPIRLRGFNEGSFEFETNLSIGSSVSTGLRYNLTKEDRYFEFTGGIGITKVNLKPSNSNLENETLSPAAFTIALGFLFHYDKMNAGLFLGWDKISGEEQQKYDWKHNNDLWLGIGLNIGVLNLSKNNRERTQSTNK